jgi:hypothetical protein
MPLRLFPKTPRPKVSDAVVLGITISLMGLPAVLGDRISHNAQVSLFWIGLSILILFPTIRWGAWLLRLSAGDKSSESPDLHIGRDIIVTGRDNIKHAGAIYNAPVTVHSAANGTRSVVLFFNCVGAQSPNSMPEDGIWGLSLNSDPLAGGGFSHQTGHIGTPIDPVFGYKCSIINYGHLPVSNVRLTVDISTNTGNAATSKYMSAIIPRIDTGNDHPFVFYVNNASREYLFCRVRDTVTLTIIGNENEEEFPLSSAGLTFTLYPKHDPIQSRWVSLRGAGRLAYEATEQSLYEELNYYQTDTPNERLRTAIEGMLLHRPRLTMAGRNLPSSRRLEIPENVMSSLRWEEDSDSCRSVFAADRSIYADVVIDRTSLGEYLDHLRRLASIKI